MVPVPNPRFPGLPDLRLRATRCVSGVLRPHPNKIRL
ncbi:hypothetical protein DFJ69_6509 [Thermomonospora umbrina]|uniref:Uncharacterized protein n=1 Tax=Thermomonospora umbrina TaxID=111806 RepID=A0A3D9TAX2_9ACTN|nr:hypothetical protein DFJ69_6509 [Thermomonospora umbrina]